MGQKTNRGRRCPYVTAITLAIVAELFASSPVQAGPIWDWLTGRNKPAASASCAAPLVVPAVPAVATVPQVAPCGTVGCAGGVCAYTPSPYRTGMTAAYAPSPYAAPAYATTAAYAPAAYPTTVGYAGSPSTVYSAAPTAVGYAPAVGQPGAYGAYAVGTPVRPVVNAYYAPAAYAPAAVPVRPTIVAAYPYTAASPAYAPTVVGYAAPRPVQAYYSVGAPMAGTCAHCNAVTSYAPTVVSAGPTTYAYSSAPFASSPAGTAVIQQGYPTGHAFSPSYVNSGATSSGPTTSGPTCPNPSSSVANPSGASLGSSVVPYGTTVGPYDAGGPHRGSGGSPADQAPSLDRGDVPKAKGGLPAEQPEVNTSPGTSPPPTPSTDALGSGVPMQSTTTVPRPRFPHKEIPDPDQGRDRQDWEFRSIPKLLKSDNDRTAGRDSHAASGHAAHVSFTDRDGATNASKTLPVRKLAPQPEWDDADWRPVNERR